MNKINKSNYEEFMIDHLDGTLSTEREAELLLFLELHPEIKNEFEGIDDLVLGEVDAAFECRDFLKKSILDSSLINEVNFEEFCIAHAEGDLSKKESQQLMNYLHDFPSLQSVFSQYSKLKLEADSTSNYGNKMGLTQFADQSSEPITMANYQDFIIANLEGDLIDNRKLELDSFLSLHKELRNDVTIFGQLKLQANSKLVFRNKSALKRRKLVFATTNSWVNIAAASVAIFMFFYFIIPTDKWDDQNVKDSLMVKQETIQHPQILHNVDIDTVQKEEAPEVKSISIAKAHNKQEQKTIKATKMEKREVIHISNVSPIDCSDIVVTLDLDYVAVEEQYSQKLMQELNASMRQKEIDNTERVYEVGGVTGRLLAKAGKVFSKSERTNKGTFKDQLLVVADYAVAGFNRMTEAELSLPRREIAASDKPTE